MLPTHFPMSSAHPSSTQTVLSRRQPLNASSLTSFNVLGSVTSSTPLYKKHSSPMRSTPFGISTRLRFAQLQNVYSSTFLSVEGSAILSTALAQKTHPSQLCRPMTYFSPSFSRPSFSSALFSFSQPSNACGLMLLTLAGRTTPSRPLSEKQLIPIVSRPSGNWTFFRLVQF